MFVVFLYETALNEALKKATKAL